VREILSRCANSIVAARAARFDAEMVEKHREPPCSQMASITLLLSRRMVRWLTDALHIVVATRTTSEDRIVIHRYQREPLARSVAVLAEVCAQHVIGGLCSCEPDAPSDLVTACAFCRRSLKHGANVTAFAIGSEVRTVKPETRSQVIEL
jgi:hypothetical protein